jgi:hypothetical protein
VHYGAADGPELMFSELPYALADVE